MGGFLHAAPPSLGSSTPGSCTSVVPTPPQERTKGDDTAPTLPANRAITTKITQASTTRVAAATVRCALHPKITSRSWAVGRTTGGHHSIHGGQTKKNPYNRRRRKGVTGGETLNKGYG
jgi:transposase InsO family protein